MTSLLLLFLFLGQPVPSSLEQVKAEPNLEHRARLAVEYAAVAERNAEADYAKADSNAFSADLKDIEESIETAERALIESHKTPGRNPGLYKYAELHTRELLIRLGDLRRRMEDDERALISRVTAKVQDIHDAWFDGIMGRSK